MSGWTWAWIAWLALFVAIEAPAVLNKDRNDTLSENVWSWFSIREKGKWWLARRLALAGFLGWLSLHLLFGL